MSNEQHKGLVTSMADAQSMEPRHFYDVIRATIMPKNATAEQTNALLMVANQYNLNPITKELYAFPTQGGGIMPIVSIDGWLKLMNDHPQFDGVETVENFDDKGDLQSITASVYRKDRSRPTTVTEYLSECKRPSSTWKQWPIRMLRHKAIIQCARIAFSFSGIYEADEAERIANEYTAPAVDITPNDEPEAPAVPDTAPAHQGDAILSQIEKDAPAGDDEPETADESDKTQNKEKV